VRNICSKCGCDVNGVGATSGSSSYIPTAAGDSSGVYPNLTLEVDGVDYYTTGNLLYTGQWVKRGFTFLTGANQTSFTLKLFNNAPGGGGNDWALDDISVATCSPDLTFTPTNNPNICANNTVDIGCIVQSYFNNYTHYKWQRSTNGGLSWSETGVGGTGSPEWNGSEWQYNVQYPTFVATAADHDTRYKVVIGTTLPNLANNNCAFAENTSTVTLHIIDCTPLHTGILSFSAKAEGEKIYLQWTTDREEGPVQYVVERSMSRSAFIAIATVPGMSNSDALNTYCVTDVADAAQELQYRIRLSIGSYYSFSRTIRLRAKVDPQLALTNPFSDVLQVWFMSTESGVVRLMLFNMNGQVVRRQQWVATEGLNQVQVQNADLLPVGLYTARLNGKALLATQRVLKRKK
jgi:hypothetical protein